MKKLFFGLSTAFVLTSSLFGTVYSDGTNPNDWKYYTSLKGEVSTEDGAISLKGNGTKSGVYIQLSPITKDGNRVKWRMKFRNYFKVYVQVVTDKGIRYLVYFPLNNFSKKSGRFLQIGLGKNARNGKWQTFTRDINKDLESLESGIKLHEIKAFFIRGTGLIDDIEVSKEKNDNESNPVDNIEVTNITSHSATIKFKDHTIGEDYFYIIEKDTEGSNLGDSKNIPALEGVGKVGTVLVDTLNPNTTYHASIFSRISFVNKDGNNASRAEKSETFTFTTTDGETFFDFKKFDELLKAEDDGEWGSESKTIIGETGNPRIKTRTIEYFMDNPPYRAVYTLSRDNRRLVEIVPNDNEFYSAYGTVKVSTDNKKLILDDGWYFNKYKYKEFDITDLPNIQEITNSKNSLYDIVGGIASNKNQAYIYEVQENGTTRDDIVGITEVFYNPLSVKDTFYMMNKSGGKAEVVLQTEMLGNGKHIATINNSILNIGTNSVGQTYDISKCSEVREGCAELISE